ncbi:MAG: DUF937 domain-containing protein [Bacteroidota bacterium]
MTENLDLSNSELGQAIVNGVSQSAGTDQAKTNDALTMALPVLMEAMERNTKSSPAQAQGLMNALSNKHDSSILDNLGSLFNGGVDEPVKNDGNKILGHILGSKKEGVENVIGQKSGLNSAQVANILKIAAPILMGMLGKQARQKNVNSQGDLGGLLEGMLGGNQTRKEQGFLERILDADGDGSAIDDVAGMILGRSGANRGGSQGGGLLGGLFGK